MPRILGEILMTLDIDEIITDPPNLFKTIDHRVAKINI